MTTDDYRQVQVMGSVDFVPFYPPDNAKPVLEDMCGTPGSNWLNQMNIVGTLLGDERNHLSQGHHVEVNMRDDGTNDLRPRTAIIELLDRLQNAGVVKQYALTLVHDEGLESLQSA